MKKILTILIGCAASLSALAQTNLQPVTVQLSSNTVAQVKQLNEAGVSTEAIARAGAEAILGQAKMHAMQLVQRGTLAQLEAADPSITAAVADVTANPAQQRSIAQALLRAKISNRTQLADIVAIVDALNKAEVK